MDSMRSQAWKSAVLAAVLVLPALSSHSQAQARSAPEPGLAPLILALEQARGTSSSAVLIAQTQTAPTHGNLMRGDHSQFPPPNAEEQTILRTRLAGVRPESVRAVPKEVIEDLMTRAVASKATYMDLLTDTALFTSEVFYVPLAALQVMDQKYVTGAMPYSGTAKDGRPFRMVALVAGQQRLDFLYDLTGEFQFDSDGFTFKIAPGGRVSVAITGPGVLTEIKGAKVYGCDGLCAWAEFVKWQKEGNKLHVWAKAFGMTQDRLIDLLPVRAK